MPLVQRKLKDMFPTAQVHTSIAPDEVMAVGAAKQVRAFVGILLEVNGHSCYCHSGTLAFRLPSSKTSTVQTWNSQKVK